MAEATRRRAPWSATWRPALRALHRDFGYLVVGLTIVYAVSGLAVNHIADWDPNFVTRETALVLPMPLPASDEAISELAVRTAGLDGSASDIFRTSDDELEVTHKAATLVVHTDTGRVLSRARQPRLLLRVANWLHLNRGKKAWTVFADGYAVLLLFLAVSGMFMLPGRKGLLGRGGLLVLLGAAVPTLYVALSGGP